jgi:hypothetical protein
MTAASTCRVGSVWVRGSGSSAGGRCRWFVQCGWTVGLRFSCAVLHIPFLDECNVVGPIFGQVLGTEDVFELLAYATVKSSSLRCIILIKVRN